jgi:hypothetical protein
MQWRVDHAAKKLNLAKEETKKTVARPMANSASAAPQSTAHEDRRHRRRDQNSQRTFAVRKPGDGVP